MNKEKIRTYDELEDDEKEVLDSFRKMKLMYDHARFKLHSLQVENLIKERNLQDKGILLGVSTDIPRILQVLNVFILPSK